MDKDNSDKIKYFEEDNIVLKGQLKVLKKYIVDISIKIHENKIELIKLKNDSQ